jgi:formate-dependent nitrite reductase membrane component NrfD
MDFEFIGLVLLFSIIAIALFMEVYKKKFRKNQANDREIYFVASLVSLVATASCYFGIPLPGKIWSLFIYFFFVYTAQFFVDMKVVKSIVKWYAKKKGVTLEGYDFNE